MWIGVEALGRILLEKAAHAARKYGACGLIADVEADNEAIARCLYRAGFFEIAPSNTGLRTFVRHLARSHTHAE